MYIETQKSCVSLTCKMSNIGAHSSGVLGHAVHHLRQAHGGDSWTRIDFQALGALWIAYRSDCIAQGCRNAVISRLLSGGILFTKADYSSLPGEDFNSHINSAFVNFAKSAIDCIYVQGFAAYIVDTVQKIPRCIPYTRADIRVRVDPETFETQLGFFRDGEDDPDPSVYFIVDAFPDEYGSLSSAMATYYEHRIFKDMVYRTTAEAESVRCKPPIYTQTETDRAFEERRLAHIGEVDGLRASITRDNALVRNRIVSDVHAQQQRLAEMLNAARVDSSDPAYRSDPLTGLRNYDADLANKFSAIVPLPADARVAAAPIPQARGDFVQVCEHLNRLASICFGVNLESVGAGTSGRSAETLSQVNSVTAATTNKFRNLLTDALVNIYDLCWREEGASEKQIPVSVMFPATVSIASMLILFNQNLVTFKAVREYLHKHMGLPFDMFEQRDARLAAQQEGGIATGLAGSKGVQAELIKLLG